MMTEPRVARNRASFSQMVRLIKEGETMANSVKGRTTGLWVLRVLLGAAFLQQV